MEKVSNYQLVLCSSFATVKNKLVQKWALKKWKYKVGYIKNAADFELDENSIDPWRVKDDRDAFVSLWYDIENIDLRNYSWDKLKTTLQDKDIIFVGWWNTYYLLDLCNKSWFSDIIKDLVTWWIIYISTSAGSIVAGPEISYIKAWELAAGEKVIPLESEKWLCITDISVYPHIWSKYFLDMRKIDAEDMYYKTKQVLVLLHDDQAILIKDNLSEIIG